MFYFLMFNKLRPNAYIPGTNKEFAKISNREWIDFSGCQRTPVNCFSIQFNKTNNNYIFVSLTARILDTIPYIILSIILFMTDALSTRALGTPRHRHVTSSEPIWSSPCPVPEVKRSIITLISYENIPIPVVPDVEVLWNIQEALESFSRAVQRTDLLMREQGIVSTIYYYNRI